MDLIHLLREENDDRCAISGMPMNFSQFSDRQASIDRIDDSKGYTAANVRITCLEAQAAAAGQRMASRKWVRTVIDDVEHVMCCDCKKQKPRSEFPAYIRNGCKECDIMNRETWHGASRLLLMHARQSTKERNQWGRDHECTITILDILQIAKAQGGMCAYSSAPMDTRYGSNRKMSLERKNVHVGYTKDNCILVTQRYNASDVTARSDKPVTGSGGWSKEKS
ncbi:unnamed protein product, partial [Phaeothamnion confervicola]